MIKRVKIDGYKSFRDFELEMKPLMVIFGPNASGKSNFFDALQLISLIGTEKDLNKVFNKHRGLPLESVTRSKTLDSVNGSSQIFLEVDVELSESATRRVRDQLESNNKPSQGDINNLEKRVRYRLELIIDESVGEVEIDKERLVGIFKNGKEKGGAIFTAVGPNSESQDIPGSIIYKGDSSYAYDEDSSYVSLFGSPKTLHEDTTRIYPFYYESNNWCFYYLDPKGDELMRADSPIKDVKRITSRGGELAAFLYTLKHKNPKQFDNFSRTLNLLVPEVKELDIILTEPDKKVRLFLKDHHGDYKYSPTLMSEGTLRVIGLLAILNSIKTPTVIGFEEPENGVHPARLKLIADAFKNTVKYEGVQVIINTHSPDFVGFFEDKNCFICRRDKGLTKIEPLAKVTPMYRKKIMKEDLIDILE